MKRLLCLCFLTMWGILAVLAISPLSFSGSIPENGGKVSSFNDIQIMFDFSEIEQEFGSIEGWGVSREGFYDTNIDFCSGAVLYEGDIDDGVILSQLTNTISPSDEEFVPNSNAMHLSFAGVPVESGKKYTVFINYIVYAKHVDKTGAYGYNDLYDNPIILELYGEASAEKQLSVLSSSFTDDSSKESIGDVHITFNNNINVNANSIVSILEGSDIVASSSELSIINDNTLVIHFENIPVYASHNYNLVIGENTVYCADEANIGNPKLSFAFEGASYHEFGTRRILPSSKKASLLEEIQVIYDFPEGCGFVNRGDDFEGYPMKVYKGEVAEENYLTTIMGGTSPADNESLIFNPDYDFEAESTYSFVIEEGVVKAWVMGAANEKTLPDYMATPVSVTYNTPAINDIPKVTIKAQDAESIPEIAALSDEIKVNVEPYRYADTDYDFVIGDVKAADDVARGYVPLYEIENGVETLIGHYFFYNRNTKNEGCYLQLSTDESPLLAKGKEYEFRFPAGMYVANQKLLRKHSGNEAFVYRFKGGTATEVNVTYTIVNAGSIIKAEPINKPVTVEFAPEADWIVKEVRFNNEVVELDGNSYTTDALTEDATISVEYAYDKEIPFLDLTVGVDGITVDGTDYLVFSDMGNVVIDNLTGGEHIVVYNLAGQVLGEHTMMGGNNRVQIPLPEGMYIIRVNDTAFKLKHKD